MMLVVSAFFSIALACVPKGSMSSALSLNHEANLESVASLVLNGSNNRSHSHMALSVPKPIMVDLQSRLRSETTQDDKHKTLPLSEWSMHHPSQSLVTTKLDDTGLTLEATSRKVAYPIMVMEGTASETPSLTPSIDQNNRASTASPTRGLAAFFETEAPVWTSPSDATNMPPFSLGLPKVMDSMIPAVELSTTPVSGWSTPSLSSSPLMVYTPRSVAPVGPLVHSSVPTTTYSPAPVIKMTILTSDTPSSNPSLSQPSGGVPVVDSSMPSLLQIPLMTYTPSSIAPVGPLVRSNTPITTYPPAPVIKMILSSDAPSYNPTLSQPSVISVMGLTSPSTAPVSAGTTSFPSHVLTGSGIVTSTPRPPSLMTAGPTAEPTALLVAAPLTLAPTHADTTTSSSETLIPSTAVIRTTFAPSTFHSESSTTVQPTTESTSHVTPTTITTPGVVESTVPTKSSVTFPPTTESMEPTLLSNPGAATMTPSMQASILTIKPTVLSSTIIGETLAPTTTSPAIVETVAPTTTSPTSFPPTAETLVPKVSPSMSPTVEMLAPTNRPTIKTPSIAKSPTHSYSRHRGSQCTDCNKHQSYYSRMKSRHHPTKSPVNHGIHPTKIPLHQVVPTQDTTVMTPVAPLSRGRGKPPTRRTTTRAPTSRTNRDHYNSEWW